MRRWLLVAVLAVGGLVAGRPVSAGKNTPSLTIVADGATMEFRTLGLVPGFTLAPGERRTFTPKPGRYVVVQAPPVAGSLRVACSGSTSFNQFDLKPGSAVTCTYTITP